jgi:hypothetical protein
MRAHGDAAHAQGITIRRPKGTLPLAWVGLVPAALAGRFSGRPYIRPNCSYSWGTSIQAAR